MTKEEAVQRLRTLHENAERGLALLETELRSSAGRAEVQSIFQSLKSELKAEYKRMSSLRSQKNMEPSELYFFKPAIQEAWADTGISSLHSDAQPTERWKRPIEAVSAKIKYYLDQLERNES
jgi:hypothetical protein